MNATKRYEIITFLPAYGPMAIPISQSGKPFYSEEFVVKFFKKDGTEWVGNFAPGFTGLNDVIELANSPLLLVISGGMCYLMNENDTQPIDVFGDYYEVMKASKQRWVLVGDYILTIVEADGTYWNTEGNSTDGFIEVEINDNIVSGLAFIGSYNKQTDEWLDYARFEYDIDTQNLNFKDVTDKFEELNEIQLSERRSQSIDPIDLDEGNSNKKRPWWLFWLN